MSISTRLADYLGKEITLNHFIDFGGDYVLGDTVGSNESMLDEIGTALFWLHASQTHTGREPKDILLRSRALERSLRDIGMLVLKNVLEAKGRLLIDGKLVSIQGDTE